VSFSAKVASPLATVVTVCRNPGSRVDLTAASVALQARADVEWLVIDGASDDGTPDRAEAWRAKIPGPVRIVSEPDAGIYDAMNKGLRLASGKWLLFLNAGDTFFDEEALAALLVEAADGVELVTGRVRFADPSDGFVAEAGDAFSWDGVAHGRVPPHPACLYDRSAVLRAGGYNEAAGIAADTKLTLQVGAGGRTRHVARVIAIYTMDGVSSRFDWRWRVHRDKARAIRAAAPAWVWARYRRRWPIEALRATASYLLRCAGLLGPWRALKRAL